MSWLWTTSEERAKLRRAGVETRAQQLVSKELSQNTITTREVLTVVISNILHTEAYCFMGGAITANIIQMS